MATVLVKSDVDETILLNERVKPAHLDSEQSSVQFLERLAWAIEEAEKRQSAHPPLAAPPISSRRPRVEAEAARTQLRKFNRLLG